MRNGEQKELSDDCTQSRLVCSVGAAGPCSDPLERTMRQGCGRRELGRNSDVCVFVPNTGGFWAPHLDGFLATCPLIKA